MRKFRRICGSSAKRSASSWRGSTSARSRATRAAVNAPATTLEPRRERHRHRPDHAALSEQEAPAQAVREPVPALRVRGERPARWRVGRRLLHVWVREAGGEARPDLTPDPQPPPAHREPADHRQALLMPGADRVAFSTCPSCREYVGDAGEDHARTCAIRLEQTAFENRNLAERAERTVLDMMRRRRG
jgi:hypothetical protein